MTQITVTAEDLQQLSIQVSNGASNIQQELGSLSNQVGGVVNSSWIGAASGQFDSLYTEWQTSATNLQQALTGISTLLSQAGTQYQNTEDAIKSSMAA